MALALDLPRPLAAVAALAVLLAVTAPAPANPVLTGADPDIAHFDGLFWMYPTTGTRGNTAFKAFSSNDLANWSDRGIVLDFKDVPWTRDDGRPRHGAWAPGILRAGGKFYLYYSVGPQDDEHPSRIGVAVADRPQGPFKDSGRVLVTGGRGFEAIDAMAFTDPKSKVTYLYAGGSAGAKLRVWELGPDFVSLKREIEVKTPEKFTEGAFVHERDGLYYLSYSHGGWNTPDYSVHYATGPSPTGPWDYRGPILASDATHQGPGHHSFVRDPASGEWFIAYHRWETPETKKPLRGQRRVAIERVRYDAKGTIVPIKMTDKPAVSTKKQ